MGLDNAIKALYFSETMEKLPPHGSFATRLAALEQRVVACCPLPVAREGGARVASPWGEAPRLSEQRELSRSGEGTATLSAPSLAVPSPNPLSKGEGFLAAILIGASKTQPAEVLEEAIVAGLVNFGENKVQEAQSKWPALKSKYPHVRLHLIGPLQSNKAADAVALFDVIHTVDRVKIADALADACKKLTKNPTMLVQVNTGEEPQKAGVAPRDVAALLAHCQAIGLSITGLMCVPPENENPAPHFALLKKMADTLGVPELSMGMSGDFETAIRLGSTMVRVGTALFGARR
jgi:PLP dependent protein